MTDKLRQAAEMALEALEDMNCGWKYIRESHGDLYGVGWDRAQGKADDAIKALRQALDQLPDTTKMIDTGTDRGAWSDVPDATKWVDELRGDDEIEEPPNSTTDVVEPIGEIVEAHGLIAISIPKMPPVGTKLYAAPPKPDLLNQTCCECERSGGYALYCVDCWQKSNL
jgi:hypothetical protein